MQKYAMIGGVLSIVSGAFGIFITVCIIVFILLFAFIPFLDGEGMPTEFSIMITVINIFYSLIALFMVLVSALAIVGGVFGIKRRIWPLALAGAIAGTFTCNFCGIPAIIFTTMAKPEFDEAKLPAVTD